MLDIHEYIRLRFHVEYNDDLPLSTQYEYLQLYINDYFIPTFEKMEDEI